MNRRDFLIQTHWTGVGVLCAAAGTSFISGCAGSFQYATYVQKGDRLIVPRSEFTESNYVMLRNPQAGERSIYLHRDEDGRYTAVLTRCTHRGCQVNPAGPRLACTCHGSEFSPTGEVLEGPADAPLRSFPVTVDPSNITIKFS